MNDEETVALAAAVAVEGVEAVLQAADERRPKGMTRARWRAVVVAALMGCINQHFGAHAFGRGDRRASKPTLELAAKAGGAAAAETAARLTGTPPAIE